MDAFNGLVTKLFDLLLTPLEAMGREVSMIVVGGIFGVLALVVFKHISSQHGIKAAKDKIKGHMIAIRLYQDDLGVVGASILKVLARNLQYVALNFAPFLPLAIPFVFVIAQMVVRYSFDPLPVVPVEQVDHMLAGKGTELRIEFKPEQRRMAGELQVVLPEGLVARSPLVRVPSAGLAFQELVATAPGVHQVELRFPDGKSYTKTIVAGSEHARLMQPERVSGLFSAALWPAEDSFDAASPLEHVAFAYPERDCGWLPMSGPLGVMTWFVVASMVFAFAAIKPLGVQI
ncbi:MAG: hypothetical protein H6828_05760 [Planctomycetes bacterium]|nr:hypothetical protein [Planctomycetota bacterium]